jgi:RNA polymerase sigma factor (sigma-70 family)
MVHMGSATVVSGLVRASADGDPQAWNELVRRFAPLVLAVTRRYQLSAADAQDVSQTVWLRLVEHLDDLHTPDALPGWIRMTAQRECGRYVRSGRRTVPVDPHSGSVIQQPVTADLDGDMLRTELRQALRDGLAELPPREQRLLRLRAADPPKSYQEISDLTGMPVSSIGPTLGRCLKKLRQTHAVRTYLADDSDQRKPGRRWST